jgi:AraC family ethanolamine operon transcriptional activator
MTGSFLNHSFSDFDELTEAVRTWDLDFRQLERGPFRGSISQFVGNGVQFGRARFGRGLEQFGSPPGGLRTFAIPAYQSLRLHWRGKSVSGTQILAFPRGGELNAVSNAGFDIFTLSLSDETLARAGAACGFPDLCGEREVFETDPGAMWRLRQLCMQFHHRIEEGPFGPGAAALQHELEPGLAAALLAALNSSTPSSPASPRLRGTALQRSLGYIGDLATEPVTVRDLIGISGASWRTLDYAFRGRFGITPKEYLKSVRLNGVHRELRRADPSSGRISDVANRWSFWHMGQFAADYRRLFGELPSATLKRNGRGS